MIELSVKGYIEADDILGAVESQDDFIVLVAGLLGEAEGYLNVRLDMDSTLEADAELFKQHAANIKANLSPNQKIVTRAFLTALLAELEDA